MKISLTIEFPDALAEEFVQLIRNFDVKHDPRHEDIVKLCWVVESAANLVHSLQLQLAAADTDD